MRSGALQPVQLPCHASPSPHAVLPHSALHCIHSTQFHPAPHPPHHPGTAPTIYVTMAIAFMAWRTHLHLSGARAHTRTYRGAASHRCSPAAVPVCCSTACSAAVCRCPTPICYATGDHGGCTAHNGGGNRPYLCCGVNTDIHRCPRPHDLRLWHDQGSRQGPLNLSSWARCKHTAADSSRRRRR